MVSSSAAPSSVLTLVGTGVALGFVHVLTGPDHLSAMATLSSCSDWCTSFTLGVRWGIGHSTGLILVGGVFILKDYLTRGDHPDENEVIDIPDSVGHFFEMLVGFFMIGLGIYSLMGKTQHTHYHLQAPDNQGVDVEGGSEGLYMTISTDASPCLPDQVPRQGYTNGAPTSATFSPDDEAFDIECDPSPDHLATENGTQDPQADPMEVDLQEVDSPCSMEETCCSWRRQLTTKSLAILAGIIHGLAGPGGVLGVIPAVQLHDWRLALAYLSSFCISSTVTMGIFASSYGALTDKLGGCHASFESLIRYFSACLSIGVGILWLVLLAFGKLDDVFP